MLAFILLEVEQENMTREECNRRLGKIKNIVECYHVYGTSDVILKVEVKDSKELGEIVLKKLKEAIKIKRSNTLIVAE
jgi:DNA-binding Lrp family transcriptional regulator